LPKKSTLYLETTIPSYLAARPSRDLIIAAHQQITYEWWNNEKPKFNVYVSRVVLKEINEGDPYVASIRTNLLQGIKVLPVTDEISIIAEKYLSLLNIPKKSALDALHLAYAVLFNMDYLLTWNCKHLAHAEIRKKLKSYNDSVGLKTPEITTPNDLMGRD